jgi:serine/threonine protein kinase/tetratricopeptide (TPR) repeat protein
VNSPRWRQVSELYHAARACAAENRSVFLDSACGGDEGLRSEVEALLATEVDAAKFLDRSRITELSTAATPTSATDPPRVQPGGRLGTYRLERPRGTGGMGTVFLAYDMVLHRQVAIKLIDQAEGVEAARATVLREARAAAALHHPNICTTFEVGETSGTAYIAMEYVEGRSLSARLLEGPMLVEDAQRLAIQAADALAYAHERGVVHRDLKAANTIVTADGRLKIVDFGLARRDETLLAGATTMRTAVPAGSAVGTPYAMAPEQVRGERADCRTDVWAIGVLLYEMLTATPPFDPGQPLSELFSSVLRDAPPPLPASVPVELRQIVDRCLEKNPVRRYQTAAELRSALDASMRNSTAQNGTGESQRRTALVWSGAAAGVLVLWLFAVNRIGTTPSVPAPHPIASIAVLPLENLSGDPEQAYFSDGITETLITRLARIDGLRVVPRAAVVKYQGARRPPPEIARDLGVEAILDGTVARSGDRVRITVNLIDPATNRAQWADSYDRHLQDVLGLQAEVAQAIAGELRMQLTVRDQARIASGRRPMNPTAYDLYLRGITRLEQVNALDAEAAVSVLEQAVALDSGFADAFGALAAAYVQLYGSYGQEDASRLEPKARAAIERALALDPESAEALAARGDLEWDGAHGWPHEESIRAHREALVLKPNLVRSQRRLATLYNHVGLADLALRQLRESDDSPAVLMQKALAFRIQGRRDLALASWLAIPTQTRNTTHVGHLVWALTEAGRTAEAWSVLRDVKAGTVDINGMLSAAEALLLAKAGKRLEAERHITAATARATTTRESHHATYLAAAAYAELGNGDQALRWLRFTATNGYPCYPLMAEDPHLDALRSLPAFTQFLDELQQRFDGYRSRLER